MSIGVSGKHSAIGANVGKFGGGGGAPTVSAGGPVDHKAAVTALYQKKDPAKLAKVCVSYHALIDAPYIHHSNPDLLV